MRKVPPIATPLTRTTTPRVVLGALTVLLTVGCVATTSETPLAGDTTGSTTPGVLRMLDALPDLAPDALKDGYRRSEFGAAWADIDANGCNQRDDVLYRDADRNRPLEVRRQGSCDHDVIAGTWRDPYTGRELTFTNLKDPAQAQAIQIDHVVSLADAWASGAWAWTPERRLQFANDEAGLLAVDGAVNQTKSDREPPRWLPPTDPCGYVRAYVRIKSDYGLGIDARNRTRLRALLLTC